jgi:hypothetical protein
VQFEGNEILELYSVFGGIPVEYQVKYLPLHGKQKIKGNSRGRWRL